MSLHTFEPDLKTVLNLAVQETCDKKESQVILYTNMGFLTTSVKDGVKLCRVFNAIYVGYINVRLKDIDLDKHGVRHLF